LLCEKALPESLPGIYIGGSVGQSKVSADPVLFLKPSDGTALTNSISLSKSTTGWKVLAGWRPIPLAGLEVDYIDFGKPSAGYTPQTFGLGYRANWQAKAATAFGVLYAPIPLPVLDVYAKAGVARLQETVNGTGDFGCWPPLLCAVSAGVVHRDQSSARIVYGAGVQAKLRIISVRLEYERIGVAAASPDLLSLGLIWNLL